MRDEMPKSTSFAAQAGSKRDRQDCLPFDTLGRPASCADVIIALTSSMIA
jgi:hypothetical protein